MANKTLKIKNVTLSDIEKFVLYPTTEQIEEFKSKFGESNSFRSYSLPVLKQVLKRQLGLNATQLKAFQKANDAVSSRKLRALVKSLIQQEQAFPELPVSKKKSDSKVTSGYVDLSYTKSTKKEVTKLPKGIKVTKTKAKAQKKPSNPTPDTDLQSQVAELTKSVAEVTKTVTGLVDVVAKIATK